MPTYNTLAQLFTDIAGAIRNKENTSANIVASDFPRRILALPGGDPAVNAYFTLTRTEGAGGSKTVHVYVGYPWPIDGAYGMKWEELEVGDSMIIPVPDINMTDETWQQEPKQEEDTSGYQSESMAVSASALPVAVLRFTTDSATMSNGVRIIKGDSSGTAFPSSYSSGTSNPTYYPVFINPRWNSSTTYGMCQGVMWVARRVFTSGSTVSIATDQN